MSRARVVAAVIVASVILLGLWMVGRRRPQEGVADRREGASPGAGAVWRGAGEEKETPSLVEGVVNDAGGRPVAGALVLLSREPDPSEGPFGPRRPVARATTEASGRFRIPDVRPGKYLATAVAGAGGPARSPLFTLARGETRSLTLVLAAAGHAVEGQVLDSGGGGIAGATVTAQPSSWQPMGGPIPMFQARSDDRGRYRLMLSPGEARLRAEASGYAPAEQPVAVTRSLSQDLRLHPAARVSGRVIERTTRRPVAEAEVRLDPVSRRAFEGFRRTRADAEGAFAFDDAEGGSFQVTARRGPQVGNGPVIRIVEAEAISDLEIETDAAAAVSGRAVDERGGGVAGARVNLWNNNGTPFGGALVLSGADGTFRADGVQPGTYLLRGESPDTAPATGDPITVGRSDVRDIKLVMTRGAVVEGKVLSADGKPVAGAKIEATMKGVRAFIRPVASGEDGGFRVAGVAGGPVTLQARSAEAGVGRVEVGPVAPGQTATVTLKLLPASTLNGIVKRSDGGPAPGIAVAVTGQESGLAYDSATSGADGRFIVQSLPPGRYTVWARRKGGPMNISTSSERPDLKIVEIGAGKNEVELTVGSGGKSIAGTVVLADGKPAPGAIIVANKESGDRSWKPDGFMATDKATARPDGSFLLEDLDDGTFRLWASRPGFPDTEVQSIAAGRRDVRIELRSPASAAGAVTTADGKPVTMFTLTVLAAPGAGDSSPAAMIRAREGARPPASLQDPRGAFIADGLEAGTYDLKATSFEGGVAQQRVTLSAGEKKQGLRLVIQASTKVTGKVVALEDGAPIAGARVGGRLAGRFLDAQTRADGTFELTSLAAGDQLNLDVRDSTREDVVPESREVNITANGANVDLGLIKLMRVEAKWFERSRDGVGLGFSPRRDGSPPTIASMRPGSAAEKAGLKPGDLILRVDGRDVSSLGPGALQWLLTGKPGTPITLSVQTPGSEPRPLTVTRLPPTPPPTN